MTVIKRLEHLTHEERLRQLGLFLPCRRDGLGGSYINVCSYVMVESKEDGARLFSCVKYKDKGQWVQTETQENAI